MTRKKYTHYTAHDRRCYNGACCPDLQKEMDSLKKLDAEVKKRGGHCTYFPMEGMWSVWVDNNEVTEPYDNKGDAMVAFLDKHGK